jgi:hypothetical protein
VTVLVAARQMRAGNTHPCFLDGLGLAKFVHRFVGVRGKKQSPERLPQPGPLLRRNVLKGVVAKARRAFRTTINQSSGAKAYTDCLLVFVSRREFVREGEGLPFLAPARTR